LGLGFALGLGLRTRGLPTEKAHKACFFSLWALAMALKGAVKG